MPDLPKFQHLRAVVFDWAGTVIDFGSHAPMGAFVRLFAEEGVAISIEEARVPMGLPKWEHIEALLNAPRITEAWARAKGAVPTREDVDRLYARFTPMSAAAVREHATLVPGVSELVAALREAGLKLGSTTGYNRAVMAELAPLATAQGFAPDALVCAEDVPESRPSPLAIYRCLLDLAVWPAHAVVKVDDTVPGLLEGAHAGCWTVGVLASGNEAGLTLEAWQAMNAADRAQVRRRVAERLDAAHPDALIDTVADLPEVLARIEERLARGERPRGIASTDED
ncbi:MAG: phosphonoacetaldehyde hydrolase [Casimicrobiaceae bacterium]|nr:phosphonoacetaldehyde hydrolase [Casimicrobiaceae bacterium]